MENDIQNKLYELLCDTINDCGEHTKAENCAALITMRKVCEAFGAKVLANRASNAVCRYDMTSEESQWLVSYCS